jgi:hypothetical protein
MVIELDYILNFLSKTENLAIIISIVSLGVAFRPMLVSYFENKKIPKLEFDGFWKKSDYVGMDYFVRVKKDKGDGEAEGVKGFVGIKNKIELNPSIWIWTKKTVVTNIAIYDYLSIFKIFEHKGHEIITFNTRENLPPPDDNNLYEDNRYSKFKDDELIVEIMATRARIKEKQCKKKIEYIVNKAKQIPM